MLNFIEIRLTLIRQRRCAPSKGITSATAGRRLLQAKKSPDYAGLFELEGFSSALLNLGFYLGLTRRLI